MYLITNEGLKVLEESGLKEILDSCFKSLDDYMLSGAIYDDQIEEYAKEHGIPDLVEKVEEDGILGKRESFVMHSKIICDLLKDKLPKNIKGLENAISAYYIYYDHFLKNRGYRGSYLWRDDNFLNIIEGDVHGDMYITQYDITSEPDLFGSKSLVKKTEVKGVVGYYSDWPKTLIDFITFCLQIKKPVPFRNNWEKEFYKGDLKEEKPGCVAESCVKDLKYTKEGEKYSHIDVLPFVDNPFRHISKDKNAFHTQPIRSSGGFVSYPFIDGDNLVYLCKSKRGVEFLRETWGDPSVRFSYDQIPNAIKGVISCIQNHGTRCQPHDAGLIFKYFPYEKFGVLD